MKYLISEQYGCVYWLEEGDLYWTPLYNNHTFDTSDGGAVERPHDEVPEEYYESVITELVA